MGMLHFFPTFSLLTIFLSVVLGKYHYATQPKIENDHHSSNQSEEETLEQILRREKSAAGILCQLRLRHGTDASHLSLIKDVLGIVATLGRVDDDNLSRSVGIYMLHAINIS